jgi:hypothetical protein
MRHGTAAQAIHTIKAVWPRAFPNQGFRDQLELFGEMRSSLSLDHPVYRLWTLRQVLL